MMLKGHIVVATGGFLLFKAFPFDSALNINAAMFLELMLVYLGCVLPDIDHRESTLGKRVKVLSYPISILFGHRGAFHSLLACAGMAYVSHIASIPLFDYVVLGYALHLVGDYLTPSGVPLFFPLKKRYRFAVVAQTDTFGEVVLSLAVLSLGVYMAFFYI